MAEKSAKRWRCDYLGHKKNRVYLKYVQIKSHVFPDKVASAVCIYPTLRPPGTKRRGGESPPSIRSPDGVIPRKSRNPTRSSSCACQAFNAWPVPGYNLARPRSIVGFKTLCPSPNMYNINGQSRQARPVTKTLATKKKFAKWQRGLVKPEVAKRTEGYFRNIQLDGSLPRSFTLIPC